MEAFTLLKYWHTIFAGDTTCPVPKIISGTGTGSCPYSDHDDGPFFDLEFSLTDAAAAAAALEDDEWEENPETESESGDEEEFSDDMDCLEFVPKNDHKIEKNEENCKGPLVSLFARENTRTKDSDSDSNSNSNSSSNERLVSKEVVKKYLKMLKPLYSIESLKCGSGRVNFPAGGASPPWTAAEKGSEELSTHRSRQGSGNNLQSGLKVVLKHLGKSRSSSALRAAPAPSGGRRSDDSLVELQDGIQGAILYCKRSYSMPTPRINDS